MSDKSVNIGIQMEISVETLVDRQMNRLDMPYTITDVNKMINWINDYAKTSKRKKFTEKDIDNMFDNAYEAGESWLEGINFDIFDERI